MPIDSRTARATLEQLLKDRSPDALAESLAPKAHAAPARPTGGTHVTPDAVARRWQVVPHAAAARDALLDARAVADAERYARNIEYYVGTVRVPVGLAGPLRVNGTCAQGDYYVPLATTEAALVASYARGMQLLTECGGASVVLLDEGMTRSPAFAFRSVHEAGQFVAWVLGHLDELRAAAESTTRYGRLKDVRITVEGNHVYLICEFLTGDAAGQNMVTVATQAACDHILAHCPTPPTHWFIEANHSGDKKASAQSFLSVRGRSVTAEVRVPAATLERRLHTTPARMMDYWQMSALGGVLSGTIGVQGHYANGLAALYLACGQDVACVAESAVGVTRFSLDDDGTLYAAVTLPNLVVGTVGGGTGLPSQRACLEILGLAGAGHARALAEVAAAVALAGELSIVGAIAAHGFTRAHASRTRGPAPMPAAPLATVAPVPEPAP
jgi:hydroxymethylglutaryl-CoA reductase (NADPH)